MRMHTRGRNWSAVILVFLLAAITLTAPPSSETSPGSDPGALQQMLAQQPLARAATILQREVERRGYAGFTSLVLEGNEVVMRWKDGRIPVALAPVLAEARTIARVRIAAAPYSLAELKAAAAQVRAQAGPGLTIQAVKFDGTGRGLIVSSAQTGDPEIQKSIAAQSLPDVGLPAEVVIEPATRMYSRNNDQSPWSGGATIVNTRGFLCTSGFGVRRGAQFFLLTAAHCGNQGDTFNDGSGERIGTVVQRNTQHDQGLVSASSASNRMYVGNRQSNTTKVVSGWQPSFIGELLCNSGVTSAQAVGGPVCNVRVTALRDDPIVESRHANNQTAGRPGDSGGPVYADRGNTVIAKGTVTGGDGAALLLFHDMPNATRIFNIDVVGGGNPDPNPGTGVVFFQDINFGGAASQSLARGSYTLAQLQARGVPNDWASSARVPAGFTVRMFRNNNFMDTQWTLASGNHANFLNLSPNANDQLSSVRIE
jgi:hypothetical protein